MANSTDSLFVYGTLAPGRSNHSLLEDLEGTWSKATLRGHLLDEGWGAEMGYPGIVPAEDGPAISGFVLSSPSLTEKWKMLDEFEGEAYHRKQVSVLLETGEEICAYVYALRRAS